MIFNTYDSDSESINSSQNTKVVDVELLVEMVVVPVLVVECS